MRSNSYEKNFGMVEWSNQFKGTVYCLAGIFALTPDTLLLREVSNVPDFTVQFYRYIFYGSTVLLILISQQGRNSWVSIKSIGWVGLLAGIIFGASNFLFTFGIQNTAVGTVVVINATNPIFSAIFSKIFLNEQIPYRTIVAAAVCFASVVVIFYGVLSNPQSSDIVGILSALGAGMTFGLYFVIVRLASKLNGFQDIDLMPCNFIAGYVVCLISLIIGVDFQYTISPIDWMFLVLQGGVGLAIAFCLLTIGPSLISAPEVSLYTLIETILGPIWVWLGGYEIPPPFTIYGGIAMVLTLGVHSYLALKEERSDQLPESVPSNIEVTYMDMNIEKKFQKNTKQIVVSG